MEKEAWCNSHAFFVPKPTDEEMTATAGDIMELMEAIAPRHLAEEWDNPGLQIGGPDWPVKKILTALDPLPTVVEAACRQGVDMLITHHPLIFKPLRSIDTATPIGKILLQAIEHRMAIFSAHTNYDSATEGLNDLLARRIGLEDLRPLVPSKGKEHYKLVFFLPEDHEDKVLEALFETSAGRIGAYSDCSFRSRGTGTFRPDLSASPHQGEPEKRSHVPEVRIEALVGEKEISKIIETVRKAHPYETMAYDLYPVKPPPSDQGLGRVGRLPRKESLGDLAARLRKELKSGPIRFAGSKDLIVEWVALCSGSGSSLLSDFLSSEAQVYVSGDLRYHDALNVADAGRGMIDVGHFASEYIMAPALAEQLREAARKKVLEVEISACELEKEPFETI